MTKTTETIPDEMGRKALEAMTNAVRKAQERQWKLGLGVWVWQDGKVVNLPPPPHLKILQNTNNGQHATP